MITTFARPYGRGELRIGWASWDHGQFQARSIKYAYQDHSGKISRGCPELPFDVLVDMLILAIEQEELPTEAIERLRAKLRFSLRYRAYIQGCGLHIEVLRYTEPLLSGPDNEFNLPFVIADSALTFLAGRPIVSEQDAKAVARENEAKLVSAIEQELSQGGPRTPGGQPRMIGIESFRIAA